MNTPLAFRVCCFAALLCRAIALSAATTPDAWPIIARRGDALFEGEKPFRFFGLAAPNLHQNESQIHADFRNRFPDEYEIRDVLDSFRRMGGRATRTFSLSIASPADGGVPVYVTARRTYNEAAFRTLDRILALGREHDVRFIIPIIASQQFGGWRGVDEFAALSGKGPGAFWTDAEVKADFRHLLEFLANRRNTVSGVLYRDDPAILAWQFGNEFLSYAPDRKLAPAEWTPRITAWTLEMAAFLRKTDPNHLIMEAGGDRAAFLASPDIDVISTHLYEYWNRLSGLPTDLAPLVAKEWAECRGKKPLIVDEFGLASVDNVRATVAAIRDSGVSGGLLWSIRGHRRDGGFYCHNEGGTPINSYHFPGFAVGHDYAETQLLDLIRTAAFALRSDAPPPSTPPAPAPVLFETKAGLSWRGSTGATHYTLERAASPDGPWAVCATGLADSVIANVRDYESSGRAEPVALWTDESSPAGSVRFYRVRGHNAAGETTPSAPLRVIRRE